MLQKFQYTTASQASAINHEPHRNWQGGEGRHLCRSRPDLRQNHCGSSRGFPPQAEEENAFDPFLGHAPRAPRTLADLINKTN